MATLREAHISAEQSNILLNKSLLIKLRPNAVYHYGRPRFCNFESMADEPLAASSDQTKRVSEGRPKVDPNEINKACHIEVEE